MAIMDYPASWRVPVEHFLSEVEDRSSPENREDCESRLRQLVEWAVSQGIEFEDFTKQNVQAYIRYRKSLGRSHNTIKADYVKTRMFFVHCHEEGLLDEPVMFTKRMVPKKKIGEKINEVKPIPSEADLKALVDAVQSWNDPRCNDNMRHQSAKMMRYDAARDTAIIMLLVDTGARPISILRMNITDFMPDMMQIRILEKGGKYGFKPISTTAKNAMCAYLKVRPKIDGDLLFPTMYENVATTSTYGKHFAKYVKHAGISRITMYALRRYTITAVAQQDFWAAVGIAGHKDARTTSEHYAAHVPEHLRDVHAAVAPLEKALGIAPKVEVPKPKRRMQY